MKKTSQDKTHHSSFLASIPVKELPVGPLLLHLRPPPIPLPPFQNQIQPFHSTPVLHASPSQPHLALLQPSLQDTQELDPLLAVRAYQLPARGVEHGGEKERGDLELGEGGAREGGGPGPEGWEAEGLGDERGRKGWVWRVAWRCWCRKKRRCRRNGTDRQIESQDPNHPIPIPLFRLPPTATISQMPDRLPPLRFTLPLLPGRVERHDPAALLDEPAHEDVTEAVGVAHEAEGNDESGQGEGRRGVGGDLGFGLFDEDLGEVVEDPGVDLGRGGLGRVEDEGDFRGLLKARKVVVKR
jgi:hypothetical protein